MKFYVYHWECEELKVPGVYQEGSVENPNQRPPHWLDIPDEDIGPKLLELAKEHDVMLLGPAGNFSNYRLYFDRKNKRFTTR